MEDKYIKFYKTFHKKFKNDKNLIHCFEPFSDGGVEGNSDLKGKNYGRISSNGFCVWNGRGGRTSASRKTHKDFKRKRNSRRELQGRVNHCFVQVSHGGVEITTYYANTCKKLY
ncbi:hypothetical protein N9W24_02020 [Gammaproteobacteria bacterium]|jgi:hypothetical protein|nr:hypothetical protein [Gammaproteobacteria bacterium]|tara:strand:- start:101 stop:442 length:342 start_codon:yes stop_codon:yes gene_type:complete